MQDNPYTSPASDPALADSGNYVNPTLKEAFFSFQGRFNRARYWKYGILCNICIYIVFFLLSAIFGGGASVIEGETTGVNPLFWLFAIPLYILSVWIGFAISSKRWHDRGKSGWWNLIALIPLIGAIWILVECGCLKGDEGPNQYGPDPLQ